MRAVNIGGEGVAATCAFHLLKRAGFRVTESPVDRPKVPAIMVSERTQKLIEDVFEQGDLFSDFPRITKRVVAWGPNSEALVLPHSAVVISEQDLLNRLRSKLANRNNRQSGEPAWTVITSRPLPTKLAIHEFGSRMAIASAVKLEERSSSDSCWVESLPDGWLFLLPGPAKSGWLLSVGGSPESLLARSTLVAGQITEDREERGQFACHPQIADPFCAPGWLACGTAAMGFDPVCGDGSGNAIREAILAAAVIRAADQGGDVDALLAHYRARLIGGFGKHLAICEQFYRSGSGGAWWDEQTEFARRGLKWCAQQLSILPAVQYRLSGFTLEPLNAATG